MKSHATISASKRTDYTNYLRPRRLIVDAVPVKRAVITPEKRRSARRAAKLIVKLDQPPHKKDVAIEDYILIENQKTHHNKALKTNRKRRSLFRKTVDKPYSSKKSTSIGYKATKPLVVSKKHKHPHHQQRKKSGFLLAGSISLILIMAATSTLLLGDKITANNPKYTSLYDDDMSVAGPPVDISATPQVLGESTSIDSSTSGRVPTKLNIPALNVSSLIEPVGLHKNGDLAQPQDKRTVGWYKASAAPRSNSVLLLSGYREEISPLNQLLGIKNGDLVEVQDKSGQSFWYNVEYSEFYAQGDVPMSDLVTVNKGEKLVIIIGNGTWNDSQSKFSERFVVVAKPAKQK